ncbi:thiol:disulfide interchange protein DsbG [Bacillus sp. PR5]|nr:thiol:disulfide interchange protein DsbG [Bacillus sp. PR5]
MWSVKLSRIVQLGSLILPLVINAPFTSTASAQSNDPALQGDDYPEILRTIQQQGIKILGPMQVPGGLRAFAAKAGSQPLAIYLTPDNQHVIVGTLVDAQGQDMAQDQLKKMVEQPIVEAEWKKLEASAWVQDGNPSAPRIVYTFTDPNCPYCNSFWLTSRPWIASGKVQLRHVIVGVIRQDSPAKAAAILQAASPEQALTENERNHKNGGISPLASIEASVTAKLESNAALMTELGFGGTPAIVYRQEDGTIDSIAGLPQEAGLETILGPK